jgi:excisionase family DNA binding protein
MSPRKGKKVGGRRPTPSGLSLGAESEVMTLRDVAEYLGCHYVTALKLVRRREIPGFRLGGVGGEWRALRSELDDWIAKGGAEPPGSAPAKTASGRRGRKPKT